jgi:putative ABC transport system permease protein
MAIHDRQQTIAAILGVAFAYILIGQNFCTVEHYISQSTAYLDAKPADLWIVPPGEKTFYVQAGLLSTSALHQARVTRGVDWATPIVRGYAALKTPNGGVENVIVVGSEGPDLRSGPFNLVKGDGSVIFRPNAITVDDDEREKLGGLNLGSTLELNGHRAEVEGITWGLVNPMGSFAFAEYDFARSMLEIDADRCSLVMVGLDGTVETTKVQADLQARIPDALVLTSKEYRGKGEHFILYDAGIVGFIFMGLGIGLTVGFAIVTLAMLSSVQQNVREFGTLKAIGATNSDLRRLILCHSVGVSIVGSFVGAVGLCQLAWASRSARLNMVVEPRILWGLIPCVSSVAIIAGLLAIRRISRVEPASVFR